MMQLVIKLRQRNIVATTIIASQVQTLELVVL